MIEKTKGMSKKDKQENEFDIYTIVMTAIIAGLIATIILFAGNLLQIKTVSIQDKSILLSWQQTRQIDSVFLWNANDSIIIIENIIIQNDSTIKSMVNELRALWIKIGINESQGKIFSKEIIEYSDKKQKLIDYTSILKNEIRELEADGQLASPPQSKEKESPISLRDLQNQLDNKNTQLEIIKKECN